MIDRCYLHFSEPREILLAMEAFALSVLSTAATDRPSSCSTPPWPIRQAPAIEWTVRDERRSDDCPIPGRRGGAWS
jgi:hypothetical protein